MPKLCPWLQKSKDFFSLLSTYSPGEDCEMRVLELKGQLSSSWALASCGVEVSPMVSTPDGFFSPIPGRQPGSAI